METRMIRVGEAFLECTLSGSGDPVILLANAGCSINYFGAMASRLIGAGFATIGVNRRWIGTPYRHPKGTPLSGEFGR